MGLCGLVDGVIGVASAWEEHASIRLRMRLRRGAAEAVAEAGALVGVLVDVLMDVATMLICAVLLMFWCFFCVGRGCVDQALWWWWCWRRRRRWR